jgi:cell division initiation protein
MKITPQDIIDKEFRVKFRGFDMAEVDTFLEEVAESFFKLIEENTLLNEKVLALQQDLENSGSMVPRGPFELPVELANILEELKQDNATISAELAALKQDRQTLASFKKSFEDVIRSVKEISTTTAPKQGEAAIPADLSKTLKDLKQGSNTIGAELSALKKEVGAITGIRQEIKKELEQQLSSHFEGLDAKLSRLRDEVRPAAPKAKTASPAAEKKETLAKAEIIKEPDGYKEDERLPGYREEEDAVSGGGELEFLSEDDILDVDKLRDIFQSVLDEGGGDGHDSREGDEATADLLFLEDDLLEDHHEPEVTFSLDEYDADKKKQNHGKSKPA